MVKVNIHGNSGGAEPEGPNASPQDFFASRPPTFLDRMRAARTAQKRFTAAHPDTRLLAEAVAPKSDIPYMDPRYVRMNRGLDRWADQQRKAEAATIARNTAAEIRERNRQLLAQKRADALAEKKRKEDERLQAQLENKQRMEELQRGREQWALRRSYSHMQHTAGGNLSPTGVRNMGHRADIFEERVEAYRNRWGVEPDYNGNIKELRQGLGTAHGAYQVQDVLRMGRFGQRAAFEGNYRELVRIEHELKRIEKAADRQYKFDSSPAAQANLDRQKRALEGAREGIAAGMAGHGKLYNMLGRGYGTVMNTFKDPVVRGVMDTAIAVAAAPYVTNRLYSGVVGMGKPYIDYRKQLALQARAGGFSANAAQALELKSGPTSFIPGNALTPELLAFGMSQQDVARNYGNYGVSQSTARGRLNAAEAIRMGYLMPGNGLSEDVIGKMLGGAVSMGAVSNDQSGWNKYFRQLQGVESTAFMQGIDRSRFSQSWQSFLQSAASNGTGFDVNSLTSFFRSLANSPAGRSGAVQQSILAGVQNTSNQLGRDNAGTLVVGMALAATKNPNILNTAAGVQKFLGMNNQQFAAVTGTAPGKRALADLMAASKAHNPYAEMQAIGALAQNDPDLYKRMVNNLPGIPQYLKDIILSNVEGVSTAQAIAQQTPGSTAGYGYLTGGAGTPWAQKEAVKYAAKYGIPVSALKAQWMMESSLGANMGSGIGAVGVGQVRQPALTDYNKANGTHWTMDDLRRNPDLAAQVSAWYFQHQYQATGSYTGASAAYHYGLGGMAQMSKGEADEYNQIRMQYSKGNTAIPEMTQEARGVASALKGSESAYFEVEKLTNAVQAVFTGVTAAVNDLGKAASSAAGALRAMTSPTKTKGGYVAPDGSWIPNTAVPNDASHRVVK